MLCHFNYRPISSINQDGKMELRSSATSSLELVFNSTSLYRRVWKPHHLRVRGSFPVGFTNLAQGQLCCYSLLDCWEHFCQAGYKGSWKINLKKEEIKNTNQQNPQVINLGFSWRMGMCYSFPCRKSKCHRPTVIPKTVSFLEKPCTLARVLGPGPTLNENCL